MADVVGTLVGLEVVSGFGALVSIVVDALIAVDDFAHCSCYLLIVRHGRGHPQKCVHPRNVGHPWSLLLGIAVVTGCFALVQYCLCCLNNALEVFYLLCC